MHKPSQEEQLHPSPAAKLLDGDEVGGGTITGSERCDIGNSGSGTVIVLETQRIRINKWRVREGQHVSPAQILFLYQEVSDGAIFNDTVCEKTTKKASNIQKYKSNRAGVVSKRLCKEGDLVLRGDTLLELTECIHTTVIKDMCADCGADLRQNKNGQTSEASVPIVHTMPDLKVTEKLAQKLGHDDTRRLLADRKLVLLVDLDQTVIHTTNDSVPDNIKGIYHFQLYGPQSPWYHTRLRPGTAEFLERMSNLYELHICTFGARNYAHMIAQLLDPEGKYFSHRILSRDECFNATSKTDNLKALFPNGDSMVCIIDDREDVWNMASNLIQVKPYHFFQHTGDINAPPGLSKHELDGEGVDFKEVDKIPGKKEEQDKDKESGNNAVDNIVSSTSKDDEPGNEEESVNVFEMDNQNDTKGSRDICEKLNGQMETSEDDFNVETKKPLSADIEDIVVIDDKKESKARLTSSKRPDESESIGSSCGSSIEVAATSVKSQLKSKTTSIEGLKQQIEIEDPDDYLLYLEVILRNIHQRFYAIYDETREIPDLKVIVPKIRCEVLRGQNLVFSGLVPTQMRLEQSRAYFIAKSLGAEVQSNIGKNVTHLVAVNAGTYKVNAAKKDDHIKVVNANWLWACAERWEHVEEKLFPLDRKVRNKSRQPPAHCHSPEHVVNYSERSEISPSSSKQQEEQGVNFRESLNPLLVFTNADIESMNKDYETFFESDSSSDEGPVNFENPPMDKKLLKRKREDENSNRAHDFFTRTSDGVIIGTTNSNLATDFDKSSNEEDDDNDHEEDDDEMPSAKFRRGEKLPSDLEIGSDSNSENNQEEEDDGEWNMMGAALEREFLGLED